MNDLRIALDNFYAGQRNDQVHFIINDTVKVIGGIHAGQLASVISIQSVNPEVLLLIEMNDGYDITIPQSLVELIETE